MLLPADSAATTADAPAGQGWLHVCCILSAMVRAHTRRVGGPLSTISGAGKPQTAQSRRQETWGRQQAALVPSWAYSA